MNIAKKTLALITETMPDVKLNFPNGLRVDIMDDELVDLFEKAGTVHMALAVETATPRLQSLSGKRLDLVKAKKYIHECSKRFVTCVFFIIGFPTETYEEAMETIKFAKELEYIVQPVLSILRIYQGTSLYNFLSPTEEQAKLISVQEGGEYTPKFSSTPEFYGDFFSAEKVPLKSRDIKKIKWEWLNVISNKTRFKNAHNILLKHYNQKQIMSFYRNFLGDSSFNEGSLAVLLRDYDKEAVFEVNETVKSPTEMGVSEKLRSPAEMLSPTEILSPAEI